MLIHAFVLNGWHLALTVAAAVVALVLSVAAIGHGLAVMRQVGDEAAREHDLEPKKARAAPESCHEPRPPSRPDFERLGQDS